MTEPGEKGYEKEQTYRREAEYWQRKLEERSLMERWDDWASEHLEWAVVIILLGVPLAVTVFVGLPLWVIYYLTTGS